MATVPENGSGVFISLPVIYAELMAQGRTLDRVQSNVAGLSEDTAELKAVVKAIQGRQWPLSTVAVVVAAAALVVPLVIK
jgi:hypothetical protein